ncbi:uncharacterized protein LOC143044987 [Mytilus galloprovincialis]|uniref:uncharacterized protein LOC143044987 n=1 Tax=Mytilus galloprovincialis TaxID=29158 RepID=UPI003F7CA49A
MKNKMTNILILFCLWISLANTEKHLVTVPFNKTIPILCTDYTVIKLLNMSVEANSKCAPAKCSLSEQEHFRLRNTCNGQNRCNITSIMPNSCLLELGFFSLSYSCLEIAHNCNFENSLCGWISSSKSNGPYIWKKGSGSTKTKLTGPSKDHTSVSETGFYVYSDARSGNRRDIAQLTSGSIVSRHKQCLSFWYHMYGDDIGRLKVFQMNSLKGNKKRIFLKKSNQSNAWQQATIDLKNVGIYQIRFEATHGKGPKGDIALDDISIVNKKCADFISKCRSNAGACKGTTEHIKKCQHVNGTYHLAECSNIYMNIDKSSLRFDPEFISTACSAIYQQINDSLCTNVSNWNLCTIDMSKYTQDHPECFQRYTIKTEYECEDPQETVMNSSKFTEPVLTSQSDTTPTLFDITTAQKTSEQLETTTYLHLQASDKSQTTIALLALTSDSLDVTEPGTSKSKAQKIVDLSIFAGLAIGAALCFGILIGIIILYCKRRSNKGKLGDGTKHSSDHAIHRKTDLPQTNSNITNKVSTETDPDYQHYYEIKDIKRSSLKVQAKYNLTDNQEYCIDQNNTIKERHETSRPLNHSDYDIIVEKLQSKEDNNNKTTARHEAENYYTSIDPKTFEHDNEYSVLSSHNEICHLSLPDISSLATYVVLDPKETGFNRSKDHFRTYDKEDSSKVKTSSLNGKIIRDKTATSATNVSLDPEETGFSRTQSLPYKNKKRL